MDIEDFTEKNYRSLIKKAKKKFKFLFYGDKSEVNHVLWRHDVDFSMHRALKLAEIERKVLDIKNFIFLITTNK